MTPNAKTVASTRFETSKFMTPQEANFLGKVFGGEILSLIDLAAYGTASRFAGNVCVTASFDRVDFHEPIEVGDMVSCTGFVSFVGRTSVETTIEVVAENIVTGSRRHTNTARVTMVAIKDGKPTPVPRLICESREEKLRFLEGRIRRQTREATLAEREVLFAGLRRSSDEELDRLLATE